MALSMLVLPQPLGPINATNSPLAMEKLTSSTASNRCWVRVMV